GRAYAVLMVTLSVWSGLYVLQLSEPTVTGKRTWLIARNTVSPLTGVLFWVFAARYTDRTTLLSPRVLAVVVVPGAAVALLPSTAPDLFWPTVELFEGGSTPRAAFTTGPAFWVTTAYTVVVVAAGHAYVVRSWFDAFSVYRRQLAALAVVGGIEFSLTAAFLSQHLAVVPNVNPWPHVQLISYSTVLVAVPLGWSYLRQSLFGLRLLDRQGVIENMPDPVFVFDSDGVVRSVNDPGLRLVGDEETVELVGDEETVEGAHARRVFADTPALLDAYRSVSRPGVSGEADSRRLADGDGYATETLEPAETVAAESETLGGDDGFDTVGGDLDTNGEVTPVVVDGERRWYDVRASVISDSYGVRTGTVVVARDVTARHRHRETLAARTAELERKTETLRRQNEQLDQFASVVSHDLRSPLTVIDGHLELVREDVPDDSLAVIERNVRRMNEMIDDLLTMARVGQTVETTDRVYLRRVAAAAWEHTDTTDCELDLRVTDSHTVEADRDKLLHVFENLFRNAVDHNETPLTVRVGLLDEGPTDSDEGSTDSDDTEPTPVRDGFYVADDGGGVPPDARESVFEHGYTTSDEGTGFGLSIVHDAVTAHGWEIRVTEGAEGGARFDIEICDVD
ncbi:MAG: histidine kinase N-terminal 7TM domain-containing protein, partial [Halobaculum sp.]